MIFSPDGRYILTGTAGAQAGVLGGTADEEKLSEATAEASRGGKVVVLRVDGLGIVRTLGERLSQKLERFGTDPTPSSRHFTSFGRSRSLAREDQPGAFGASLG